MLVHPESVFRAAARVISGAFAPFGAQRRATAASYISSYLVPVWNGDAGKNGRLKFWAPSYKALYRGWSVLSKEPDTIAWIDSFRADDVLWDVGANVGVYSLYAGKLGCRVLAFEPEAGNYHVLNRNIELNRLDDKISAYCVALTAKRRLDVLNMRWNMIGSSHHHFGRTVNAVGDDFTPTFKQAGLGFSIDEFMSLWNPPAPTHIKIDVDGLEADVLRGAEQTLAGPSVRSVMMEIQTASPPEVLAYINGTMSKLGFKGGRNTHKINYLFERR